MRRGEAVCFSVPDDARARQILLDYQVTFLELLELSFCIQRQQLRFLLCVVGGFYLLPYDYNNIP